MTQGLATRCPACGTVFRIVEDQLRVSEGWVRCGRCEAVFNGLEGLFDLVPTGETSAAGGGGDQASRVLIDHETSTDPRSLTEDQPNEATKGPPKQASADPFDIPMRPQPDPRMPAEGFPPRWASFWGDDPFGLWADVVIGKVLQRMYWIEGPAGVPGAQAPAGRGFWLADIPCTEELWTATVAATPRYIRSVNSLETPRAVVVVTWVDVQLFLSCLCDRCPALKIAACVPTESQWRYALELSMAWRGTLHRSGLPTGTWWEWCAAPDADLGNHRGRSVSSDFVGAWGGIVSASPGNARLVRARVRPSGTNAEKLGFRLAICDVGEIAVDF